MQKLHERENEKPTMETANSRNDCFNVKSYTDLGSAVGNALGNASAMLG